MTNRAHLAEDVIHILSRHAPLVTITEGMTLVRDLSLDSIDRMSIACDIEDTFEVLLHDDVVDALTDVRSLVDAVEAAVATKKEPA